MVKPTLKRGDSGFDVIRLQNALVNAAGYKFSKAGTFDADTEGALREFQFARGLVVSGTTDAATWAALAQFDKIVLSPGAGAGADGNENAVVLLVGFGLLAAGVWAWRKRRAALPMGAVREKRFRREAIVRAGPTRASPWPGRKHSLGGLKP